MFEALFKNNDRESCNLKLSQFEKIWGKFCFLDESGTLLDSQSPFFTIGMIKCSQPSYLASRVAYERSAEGFYDELKFNKLSKLNINFAKKVIDIYLDTKSFNFSSYTLDKRGSYFDRQYGGDPWKAYEDISVRLIRSNLAPSEVLAVIADYVTTPREIKFEASVKKRINTDTQRFSIMGVVRIDSRSNDILQIVDLMIGAVNYDLKLTTGLTKSGDRHKRQFVDYFKNSLGTKDFLNYGKGFRDRGFNIFIDKSVMERTPLDYQDRKKEKRPSS